MSIITPVSPPARVLQIASMGQSNDVGQSAAVSTSQPIDNQKVHDSSGTYDITDPNAATLSMAALVDPLRSTTGGDYPDNIGTSEDPATSMCNALALMWQAKRYAPTTLVDTCVGVAGAAISNIKKGGTSNCYAASLYETRVIKRFAAAASKTYATLCAALVHGEANATSATYAADVNTGLVVPAQTDYAAITSQAAAVPFFVSQQCSTPNAANGFEPTSALQQLAMPSTNALMIFACATHALPFTAAGGGALHYSAAGIRQLGDVLARAADQYLRLGSWTALVPTSVSYAGSVITVNYSRPACWDVSTREWGAATALTFDTSITPGHQTGALSAWANGKGNEATDLPNTIIGVSNANPAEYQTQTAHGYSNGQTILVRNVTASAGSPNVAAVITVTAADKFTMTGVSGITYTSGGTCSRVLTISSVALTGAAQMQITLSAPPSTGLAWAYAFTADATSPGGWPTFRGGLLRDQDAFYGPCSGARLYSWAPVARTTGLT